MKFVLLMLLAAAAATGQTGTASIAGTVLDAKTQKPIPAAVVMAVRSGLPPLSKYTKSGGDGAFQIEGLAAGRYSLCVQAQSDGYIDPCLWGGSPTTVTVVSGQAAAGVSIALAPASIVNVLVQDAQKLLSQNTKEGRRPGFTLGIWGPTGLYHPARAVSGPAGARDLYGRIAYRIAVPSGTALKLQIASRDVKLGDAAGKALAGNASQQTFQQAAGDLSPRTFTFTVLGPLP